MKVPTTKMKCPGVQSFKKTEKATIESYYTGRLSQQLFPRSWENHTTAPSSLHFKRYDTEFAFPTAPKKNQNEKKVHNSHLQPPQPGSPQGTDRNGGSI